MPGACTRAPEAHARNTGCRCPSRGRSPYTSSTGRSRDCSASDEAAATDTYTTLIEPGALAELRSGTALAVMDCRHELMRPEWGAQSHAQQHIRGAPFAHLDRDLSGAITPGSGRHPLPERARLAATLSRWGVDAAVQVVAYDQGTGATAARLWWLLRFLGHEAVAVLNGGLAAWRAAGLALSSAAAAPEARTVTLTPARTALIPSGELP